MKSQSLPKETIIELLLYLAENDQFESVKHKFDGQISPDVVREVLRELADDLRGENRRGTHPLRVDSYKKYLSKNAQAVLGALSPREEQIILRDFGLDEE